MTRWKILLAVVMLCGSVCLSGCGTRTIYLKPGQLVRLRQEVKGAKIWVQDSKGAWVESTFDLPEGWYCLTDPETDAK